MSASVDLGAIARNLETYHQQLSALRQAFAAMSQLSDVMLAAMESDRAVIAAHANLQGAAHDGAPASDPIEHHAEPGAAIDEISTGRFDSELSMALGLEPADSVESRFNEMGLVVDAVADALVMPEPATGETAIIRETVLAAVIHDEAARSQSVHASTSSASTELSVIPMDGCEVIELQSRRRPASQSGHFRRRAVAVAACLILATSATLGIYELMQTDIGHRLAEIGNCDGDLHSANRDCALLAWLML
jgi:hypothetical protein